MKTSNKLIHKPDGGMIIDENDDDLFRPRTPEELRQAEARMEASAKKSEERYAEWLRNHKKE